MEIDSTYAEAYIDWGRVLSYQKQHNLAIVKYNQALELSSQNLYAYACWAATLADQNKYSKAIDNKSDWGEKAQKRIGELQNVN